MALFISMYCYVLVVMNIREALSSDEKDCRTEARYSAQTTLIASKLNQSDTGTALDFCVERLCLPFCCPIGSLMMNRSCIPTEDKSFLKFPSLHDPLTLEARPGQLRIQDFHIFTWNPCLDDNESCLKSEQLRYLEYKLLTNGHIYLPAFDKTVNFTNYCFVAVNGSSVYTIELCPAEDFLEDFVTMEDTFMDVSYVAALIISVPCFVVTFAVYSVVPELRNMHGATLRGYVGPLIFAYTTLAVMEMSPDRKVANTMCILLAFVFYYSSLVSFFWLNVMCFDIWWTFGGFRSLQASVKQWERKKFIIYSLYAWGSASLVAVVCLIMDFAPSVPKNLIKPEFGVKKCGFGTKAAHDFYFFTPMGITAICNIFFFVSTAIKIIRHEKFTAHHFKGTDSRRPDSNKQRFNIHLKLFIVMGVNWSTEIIGYFCNYRPKYLWFITSLITNLQGVIIFVIFVWKNKIKRQLLKRLGFKDRSLHLGTSTRSSDYSSASRISATPLKMDNRRQKSNPLSAPVETTIDESN